MPDFDTLSTRLGEFAVQAIIEQIEKLEGVDAESVEPLATRWIRIMQIEASESRAA